MESGFNSTVDRYGSSTIVFRFVDFNSFIKGNVKRFRLDNWIDIDIEVLVRFTVNDRFRIVREKINKKAL